MNEIEGFRDEIARIFAEASQEMLELPVELRGIGQTLLSRSNPLQNGGGTNAISFLLPYWLQEETGAPDELCRDLAIGNLYAMLHFCVLDDAMDGGVGRVTAGLRKSLALGQLLFGLFRQRYARYFPHGSSLWAYERKYMEQWASAVGQEALAPVDPQDCGQLAGKAAPVKLCAAGLLIWSGQLQRIADMEEAIDLALAVLQLSDDWDDWREDLAESNRNAFLTLVRDKLAWPAENRLDERIVKQGIYRHRCLNQLADISTGYCERLRRMPSVPRGLAAFQSAIEQGLRADAQTIDEAVLGIASEGGLSHFLSNSIKK
jgi:hypothetical protein